jgi:transposase
VTFELRRCLTGSVRVELVMGERKAYPSDLTDEQWAVVGPFLDAWKAKHPSVSGHQGRYSLREILNSIFYQNRTGCQWAYLPHDLPPKSATYYYFAVWRDDGTDQAIHDLLRGQAREKAGRRETRPRSFWTPSRSGPRIMFRPRRPAKTPARRYQAVNVAWRWIRSG